MAKNQKYSTKNKVGFMQAKWVEALVLVVSVYFLYIFLLHRSIYQLFTKWTFEKNFY